MPTRVLWVVKGLGPGGAENLLVAAARAHHHDQFHIECAYVLPWKDHLVGQLESAGVRVHCLSSLRGDHRWPLRLRKLIRTGGFEIVHVHSPLPGSVARLVVRTMPKNRRPAVVTTEHNRWPTHRLPTRLVNRWTSRWDTASVAVTDEVKASMRGRLTRRAVTVRHGIDVRAVAAAKQGGAAMHASLGLRADEIVVGTVANFRPQKDYPNLLAAAKLLADRGIASRLVAVGQGPQQQEVHDLRDQLGLADRVVLTGFRDDAVGVMAACDVFTLASQWEGLPVALMEALALGLPVVATNVGGVAEEMHDGVDALLVPAKDSSALADALQRVIGDSDLRSRLGEASRQRAAEFDVSRTIEVLERIYDDVLAALPAAPPAVVPPGAGPAKPASTGRRQTEPLPVRAATMADRPAILDLLGRSLGSDGDLRYPQLFAWKHDDNAFGKSPMWVATDEDRVVAFRTFMRWEFVRGGEVLRAVRAVDTATDPAYQGRGLFRQLTMHGLDEMRAEGVDFVFNTPNSQSMPGYLKMGWREVGRVPAAVRFVGPHGGYRALRSRVPADRWSQDLEVGEPFHSWLTGRNIAARVAHSSDVRELRTHIDGRYLAWRFGTPLLGYRCVDDGNEGIIVRARRRGAALELAVVGGFGDPRAIDRLAAKTAQEAGADYAIRIGHARPRTGFVPLPKGGPTLTWRAVTDSGMPPLSNWSLTLGDIELF